MLQLFLYLSFSLIMHFRDDEEDKTGASMTHTQCLMTNKCQLL